MPLACRYFNCPEGRAHSVAKRGHFSHYATTDDSEPPSDTCRPSKCDLSFPHEESRAPADDRHWTLVVISSPLRTICIVHLRGNFPIHNYFISGSEAHTVKTIGFNS